MAAESLDVGQLQVDLEQGAERLEKAAEALYGATLAYEKAEEAWERVRLLELANIYEEHERQGKRMPNERVQNGLVLRTFATDEVYITFRETKAAKEALDVRYRALAAATSARQSLLKAMT